ncbi:BRCA1-associated protein homolog 2-like [Anopheles darlingi]|uniref:BRCA1-associated protein homolog 2-like n=1 Tax=Anopheles darlingi TaxID=43151 RepID=UPI002100399C|nr:BRCA1-associated protein homolog 2-like [Anopheles darlingi]
MEHKDCDDDQNHAINFYTCPLCNEDKLSLEALYDHYILHHHLQQLESGEEKVKFRCPVCVCFRLENSTEYVDNDDGEDVQQPDCPICFEEMDDSDCRSTSCNHQFHRHCIGRWLENNSECPICRKNCK